jgi:molybdopterin-guanine dinucleotide biosynthesis protein A
LADTINLLAQVYVLPPCISLRSLKFGAKDGKNLCMDIGCAILAGGRSIRMGRDKATAAFRGATLVKKVYDGVREVFSDIIVVSSLHTAIDGVDAPVVKDLLPLQSPMVGIATALLHSGKPRLFVVACDMPFLSAEGIRCVVTEAGGEDITIPVIGDYYEPLHAIYRRSCLAPFLRLIDLNMLKIRGVFPYLVVNAIRDNPCFLKENGRLVFSNINTEEELARINTPTPTPGQD